MLCQMCGDICAFKNKQALLQLNSGVKQFGLKSFIKILDFFSLSLSLFLNLVFNWRW